MNPYEAARERLERAGQACLEVRAAKARIEDLEATIEAEWTAAAENLSQHETAAGIPLSQYRDQVPA